MASSAPQSSIPPIDSETGADSLGGALGTADATVAVVAPPFAGRDSVLDRAAASLDAPTRVQFAPDGSVELPDAVEGPLIVDGCHHRYAHRIGGFAPLDRFLDRLASASGRVVTAWNRHSWNYLDAVRDLSDAFGHVFTVGPLSADSITDAVRPTTDPWPAFEYAADGRASPFGSVAYRVPIPRSRRDYSIDLPTVDVDYVTGWLRGRAQPTAEALVFERLTRLTDGNPGVAAAVWEQCVDDVDGAVTPADISLPVDRDLDPGDDAARVLGILLSKEVVTRTELAAVVPDVPLTRTLRTLADHGFVTEGDAVRLRPAGLPSAVDSLARRRWLW
jgi:hypothetical protein